MTSLTLTPDQSAALVTLFDKASDAKTAFGAPGDYGYGTKEGQALYGLAKALVEAHPVIVALKAMGKLAPAADPLSAAILDIARTGA